MPSLAASQASDVILRFDEVVSKYNLLVSKCVGPCLEVLAKRDKQLELKAYCFYLLEPEEEGIACMAIDAAAPKHPKYRLLQSPFAHQRHGILWVAAPELAPRAGAFYLAPQSSAMKVLGRMADIRAGYREIDRP